MAQAEKYANAKGGYDAHAALAKTKAKQKSGTPSRHPLDELIEEIDGDLVALHLFNNPNPHKRNGRIGPRWGGTNLPLEVLCQLYTPECALRVYTDDGPRTTTIS